MGDEDWDAAYDRMVIEEHEEVERQVRELVEIVYSKMIIGIYQIQKENVANSVYWRTRKEKLVNHAVETFKEEFKKGTAMKELLKKLELLDDV